MTLKVDHSSTVSKFRKGSCGSYRIAAVVRGGRGSHTWLLEADKGALSLVLVTPVFYRRVSYFLELRWLSNVRLLADETLSGSMR